MTADFLIYGIINTIFVVLVAPLFVSLVKKIKAWTQGRRGTFNLPDVLYVPETVPKGSHLFPQRVLDHPGHTVGLHCRYPDRFALCPSGLCDFAGGRYRKYHPFPVSPGARPVPYGPLGS